MQFVAPVGTFGLSSRLFGSQHCELLQKPKLEKTAQITPNQRRSACLKFSLVEYNFVGNQNAFGHQMSRGMKPRQDAMRTQKKVLSRADAERRLISQEVRLKESQGL